MFFFYNLFIIILFCQVVVPHSAVINIATCMHVNKKCNKSVRAVYTVWIWSSCLGMKRFECSGINVDCVRVLVYVRFGFRWLKVVHDALVQKDILGLEEKRSTQKQNRVKLGQFSGATVFTTRIKKMKEKTCLASTLTSWVPCLEKEKSRWLLLWTKNILCWHVSKVVWRIRTAQMWIHIRAFHTWSHCVVFGDHKGSVNNNRVLENMSILQNSSFRTLSVSTWACPTSNWWLMCEWHTSLLEMTHRPALCTYTCPSNRLCVPLSAPCEVAAVSSCAQRRWCPPPSPPVAAAAAHPGRWWSPSFPHQHWGR